MCVSCNRPSLFCASSLATEVPTVPIPTSAIFNGSEPRERFFLAAGFAPAFFPDLRAFDGLRFATVPFPRRK
jgi:hypothetical protein